MAFEEGMVVAVASRTQPGVNKPGGVGRVTKVHADGCVDVAYVLGGRERRVEPCYVTSDATSAEPATTSRRQRRAPPANEAQQDPVPPQEPTSPLPARVTIVDGDSAAAPEQIPCKEGDAMAQTFQPPAASAVVVIEQVPAEASHKVEHKPEEAVCQPMVACKESGQPPQPQEEANGGEEDEEEETFHAGQVVHVEARTMPNVNKPGGAARISKVNEDGTYNVKYVLGGTEKAVEACYIASMVDGKPKRAAASRAVESISTVNAVMRSKDDSFFAGQLADLEQAPWPTPPDDATTPAPERSRKKPRHTPPPPALAAQNSADPVSPQGTSTPQPATAAAPAVPTQPSPALTPEQLPPAEVGATTVASRQRVVATQPRITVVADSDPAVSSSVDVQPRPVLDARQVLRAGDPKEVARQQAFRHLVAHAFTESRADNLGLELLMQRVNLAISPKQSPFAPEEFRTRIATLNTEGRVMVHEAEGGVTQVYQV